MLSNSFFPSLWVVGIIGLFSLVFETNIAMF